MEYFIMCIAARKLIVIIGPTASGKSDLAVELAIRFGYVLEDNTRPIAWGEVWDYPEELPRLVEVTVILAGGASVRRVMAIPIGSLKPHPAEAAQ